MRTLPPGGGAHLEIEAGLAAARHALVSDTAFDLDELFLIGTFLRPAAGGVAHRPTPQGSDSCGHGPVPGTACEEKRCQAPQSGA